MKKLLSGRTTKEDRIKPDHGSTTGTPRWVKVFGIIVLVLVLLVVIMMIFGSGEHGPGRHFPSSSGIEQGMKQPWL